LGCRPFGEEVDRINLVASLIDQGAAGGEVAKRAKKEAANGAKKKESRKEKRESLTPTKPIYLRVGEKQQFPPF